MERTPHSHVAVERRGQRLDVWLSRPERRNAFDDQTAQELRSAFEAAATDGSVAVVVLGGRGPLFSSGGDLEWMRRMAGASAGENLEDARKFQEAFEVVDRCPLPVVGRLQGGAFGGAIGLLAVCDTVVAESGAVLAFSEVRLGLVPGVISPYVLRRIGTAKARRWFLSGARFGAEEARAMGLVDRVVAPEELDRAVDEEVGAFLQGAPPALRRAKELLYDLRRASDEEARRLAREAIAAARASPEGRERVTAFLDRHA